MRNYGGYDFGPRCCKPSIRKEPSKLMKKSLKQLRQSQECYRVSMVIRDINNYNRCDEEVAKNKNKVVAQKNQQLPLEEPRNVRVVPRTNDFIRSSRPNNGLPSPRENINRSRSRKSSPTPNKDMGYSQKHTQDGAPPLKNNENHRRRSSRLKSDEAFFSKNNEMKNSSSLRSKNDMVSPLTNAKSLALSNSTNDLLSLEKDTESLKFGPPLGSELSSVLKDNDKSRKGTKSLLGEKSEAHEDGANEKAENCRPIKRRRKLILNEYEDDEDGDQQLPDFEIGSAGLTTQTAVEKECPIEISSSFLSESLKLQNYGSLPIDEPVWSGTIMISSKIEVSLAAHLSTKCCEEVWKLAGSLQPEIVVTKLSRLEVWPKSFEASMPTDNSIALYFLPLEMRQDADLNQLVKEVVENDLVLQAAIGEAEMLIFPSVLLPEQHQTFQGKHYLWAVFRRRKNKVATGVAQQHDNGCCARDEAGKQQASHCSVGKEGHGVTGLNKDIELEAREELERQGMEQEQIPPSLAQANGPIPATIAPTVDATMSANNAQIPSGMAVPTGATFVFVVQGTSRVEQLIQELQREGAVVVAMRGEMLGSGLGQVTGSGREEDKIKMLPSSS